MNSGALAVGTFTGDAGNACAAARFHSTESPFSGIVVGLATQLEARGLWMDLHPTPRELTKPTRARTGVAPGAI